MGKKRRQLIEMTDRSGSLRRAGNTISTSTVGGSVTEKFSMGVRLLWLRAHKLSERAQ